MSLIRGECQVARTKLQKLLRCPQPRQGELWLHAGANDHTDVVRHVADRVVDRFEGVGVGHAVEIVENQDHRLASAPEHGHQLVHGVLNGTSRHLKSIQDRVGEPWQNALEAAGDVGPHSGGVVIARVEREPHHCCILGRTPRPNRGRLPIPRRRFEQDEPGTCAFRERVQDP